MLTAEDLLRLDKEFFAINSNSNTWMENNKIDVSLVLLLAESGYQAIIENMDNEINIEYAIKESILNAFMLGWEAFRQYGPRTEQP